LITIKYDGFKAINVAITTDRGALADTVKMYLAVLLASRISGGPTREDKQNINCLHQRTVCATSAIFIFFQFKLLRKYFPGTLKNRKFIRRESVSKLIMSFLYITFKRPRVRRLLCQEQKRHPYRN